MCAPCLPNMGGRSQCGLTPRRPHKSLWGGDHSRRGDAQAGQRCGIQGNRPYPGQGEEEAITISEPLDSAGDEVELARLEDLRLRPPPPEWNGVTAFDQK